MDSLGDKATQEIEKKGLQLLISNPASASALFGGCGCFSLVLIMVCITALLFFTFNNEGAMGNTIGDGSISATTACGTSTPTLLTGYKLIPTQEGKLGHEEHLNTTDAHFCGTDSGTDCKQIGNGSFYPRNSTQERWYFNTLWGGWDWEPTRSKRAPIALSGQQDREARKTIPHKKLILTSKETGKSIVVSAEESGPALWVAERDGIWYGAPPEVYNYLGTSSPYTKNPSDGKGAITVGFAEDQNINLGPCLAQ